jgi:hypothetical protein
MADKQAMIPTINERDAIHAPFNHDEVRRF